MRIKDEKKEWLLQIGAKEFPEPIKYTYTFPGYSGNFNLSERYVENTSLNDMKAQYEKNKAHVNQVLETQRINEYPGRCKYLFGNYIPDHADNKEA